MKNFLGALLHAIVGGAAAGVAGVATGASWKTVGLAALASALTSVLSLLVGKSAGAQGVSVVKK